MKTTAALPLYPSKSSIKGLSASQQSTLFQSISTALLQTLALPPPKRDTPATRAFVSSYAREEALGVLANLIWEPEAVTRSTNKNGAKQIDTIVNIRNRVLLLAEKLATSGPDGLDTHTLLDLSIVYAHTHPTRLKAIFSASLPTKLLPSSQEMISAFTSLLSPAHSSQTQGLYALRKTSHSLLALLRPSPPALTRLFASSKPFMLALARAYDDGLAALARAYGGLRGYIYEDTWSGEVDEWERVWVGTKVDLMDSFHLLLGGMVRDLAGAEGLGGEAAERTFGIIFAMLELPSSSSSSDSDPPGHSTPTPFLNRPLLADYQHSYDLSRTLASALRHAAAEKEKDARLEVLEATLRSFEVPTTTSTTTTTSRKDPGALKILLRSSGVPQGIDNLGRGHGTQHTKQPLQTPNTKSKGKGKAPAPHQDQNQNEDEDLDLKTTQVLSILPDHDASYIRALLARRGASVESVVEMLLEGRAEEVGVLRGEGEGEWGGAGGEEEFVYTVERRNVFDDEVMDLSSVRVGKKRFVVFITHPSLVFTHPARPNTHPFLHSQEESTILHDRTFIEQMKADIIRRAEALSDLESEEEDHIDDPTHKTGKGRTVAFEEEELDEDVDTAGGIKVKVLGDGEETSGVEDEGEEEDALEEGPGEEEKRPNHDTILELAYIRDPGLFERDARKGKGRIELREATGGFLFLYF